MENVLSGEIPLEISTASSKFGTSRVCSTAWGTPEVSVAMFKAEQKAVIPKGCKRNLHFGSKIPTVNFA